jgi:hypothetical protein
MPPGMDTTGGLMVSRTLPSEFKRIIPQSFVDERTKHAMKSLLKKEAACGAEPIIDPGIGMRLHPVPVFEV